MANSNTTRNMKNGAYHKHLFKDEKRTDERIVMTRSGTIASEASERNNLNNSFGEALNSALLKKNEKQD
jgi:hypothetical protein